MKGKRSKVASFTHTSIYSEFTIIGRLMLEPFSLYILSFLFYLIFHIPPPSPSVFLNIFFFSVEGLFAIFLACMGACSSLSTSFHNALPSVVSMP
jgi:hypothetical protein